jgi:hypothetical protein
MTIYKNDYIEEYTAARAKAQTLAYAQVRRKHRAIERKLAELVRWHGARRTRYRGRRRGLIQYLLTALVVNVKRMVRLLWSAPAAGDGSAAPAAHMALLLSMVRHLGPIVRRYACPSTQPPAVAA